MKTRCSAIVGAIFITALIAACESTFTPFAPPSATPTARQTMPESTPIGLPTNPILLTVPSPTPPINSTPAGNVGGILPTVSATLPTQAAFWVDNNNTNLDAGSCTNVHWMTTNASAVFYQDQSVAANGEQKECFGAARRYDLILRIVYRDGKEFKQTITINAIKASNPDAGQAQSSSQSASSSKPPVASSSSSNPPPPASSSSSSSSPPPLASSSSSSQSSPPIVVGTFVPIRTYVPPPTGHPINQELGTPTVRAISFSIR